MWFAILNNAALLEKPLPRKHVNDEAPLPKVEPVPKEQHDPKHPNIEPLSTKQPMNQLLQTLLQNHGGKHLQFVMTKTDVEKYLDIFVSVN